MYGFGYIWIIHEVDNDNAFLSQCKQRVIDSCLQKWHSDINNSPKAKHYRCFKRVVNVELCISFGIPYELRKLLANFRCSGHNLMIEKGRHDHVDAQFRFCPLCITNNVRVIEDECHFFFECRAYEQLRNVLVKRTCSQDAFKKNRENDRLLYIL